MGFQTAEEYIFKKMMPPDAFKLFMRARSVIASCENHFQLFYAIQYNKLARQSARYPWCIDSFIARKAEEIKAKP